MTATADREQDMLVSTPEDTVLFMSRRADLRLVKEQIYPIFGASGQKVGEKPGQTVGFRAGVLRVPKSGTAQLEANRTIDAAELVEWLENHRLYKDLEDGFWRIDPAAPPITRDELDQLTEIVLELDEDRLILLLEQERAGWNREDLVGAAEKALSRIQALKAQAQG